MSIKKFSDKDIIQNTMRAYPEVSFFVFDSRVYYNNEPAHSGAVSSFVRGVPAGHLSLYEYNTDRVIDTGVAGEPTTATSIYPFITKQSAKASFRTATATSYTNEFVYGDILTGSYPLSASITREFLPTAGQRDTIVNDRTSESIQGAPINLHYWALRNRLNFYGTLSEHYKIVSSVEQPAWNKDNQTINLISIPSIFYGSAIKPGSVSLKWYFTGSLVGELQDTKQNGELIETTGINSGAVAGVILYDEGFVLLTGSWALGDGAPAIPIKSDGTSDNPKWIYFGAGAKDGVTQTTAGPNFVSASFDMSFRGQTDTQVITMFAHAKRGEVNYSNNPTYLKFNQTNVNISSSTIYEENPNRLIANTVTSSFRGHDSTFERQVYVSRVAIYDDNKNLIGIATLANPILKKEDEDYTFKLKLDI
jgi:hypothetical protein